MSSASCPIPVEDVQGDGRWLSIHNRFVNQAKEMEPDVVFIGDSLVANLHSTDLWEKWFVPLHCLNFGIGGDQTQHVLWRLKNGELECIKPKVSIILCGTNNHGHSADEVAEGIMEIYNTVREKQPQSYIVVLTIPPRGEKPNPLREKISKINKIVLQSLKDTPRCQVIDIGCDFIQSDGTIDYRDMFDYLHFTWQGYKKAFEPVYELLTSFFNEEDSSLLNDISVQGGSATTPSLASEQPPPEGTS